MKKIKYVFATALVALTIGSTSTSCSDFLEVVPENSQVSDDYWQTKQDVENVLMGGYYYLRDAVQNHLLPYGELRAGLIYSRATSSVLQTYQVTPTSGIVDWSTFYKIINVANTVLDRAKEACAADMTYTEAELKSHYTEAYFLRALSYFYLVRNWRDVPMPLKSFQDDGTSFNLPLSYEADIVDQIKTDIVTALQTGAAKESFETTWETKGRATKWALYALMADVCLWDEDYENAIKYCDALLNAAASNPKAPAFMATPSRSSYFSLFNPGNSTESVFELQWNANEEQSNTLPLLFDDEVLAIINGAGGYTVSANMCTDIVNEYLAVVGEQGEEGGMVEFLKESPRTDRASFYAGTNASLSLGMTQGYVWKYLGSTTRDKKRTSNAYDPNFIIYRMADVILMKAEAVLLVDGLEPTPEHKLEAVKCINRIRERAALEDNIAAGMYDDPNDLEGALDEVEMYSQEELLEKVLNERKIEFLGEGNIWYDFLRMGRSNNNRYKTSFLVEQVVNYNEQASESWLRSVLSSDNALFLPIQNSEIERNPLLTDKQNPYYK